MTDVFLFPFKINDTQTDPAERYSILSEGALSFDYDINSITYNFKIWYNGADTLTADNESLYLRISNTQGKLLYNLKIHKRLNSESLYHNLLLRSSSLFIGFLMFWEDEGLIIYDESI